MFLPDKSRHSLRQQRMFFFHNKLFLMCCHGEFKDIPPDPFDKEARRESNIILSVLTFFPAYSRRKLDPKPTTPYSQP